MPILVAVLILIALAYGAVQAFHALSTQFGVSVAIGAAAVTTVVLLAAVASWWSRRKAVAANIHDGNWTHELAGAWGYVRLAGGKQLCNLEVNGNHGSYIFADLLDAQLVRESGLWQVKLDVKDSTNPEWRVPVKSEREAIQWVRIFALARDQRL